MTRLPGWGVRASGRGRCGAETVGVPARQRRRGGRHGVAPAREPERPRDWHHQERGPHQIARAQRHAPAEGRKKDVYWRAYRGAQTLGRPTDWLGLCEGTRNGAVRVVASRWARRPSGSAAVRIAGATAWSGGAGTLTSPHSEDRHCAFAPTSESHRGRGRSATSAVFVVDRVLEWLEVRSGRPGPVSRGGSFSRGGLCRGRLSCGGGLRATARRTSLASGLAPP